MVVWGTHASADNAVPRPASQDTTVYGRAAARSADMRHPQQRRKRPTPRRGGSNELATT